MANNSRPIHVACMVSRRFWCVFTTSFMSRSGYTGHSKPIEGGPKNRKNQQKCSIFKAFWSAFGQMNTSRTLLDPKNMDTESYSPIRAKKFRTRFCGHLFSRQLQNGACFPYGEGFPTMWKRHIVGNRKRDSCLMNGLYELGALRVCGFWGFVGRGA